MPSTFFSGPEVSVVIPTHDRWPIVKRAVATALNQVGVDLEVLVVDDGSRDRTAERVSAIADERLQVLRLPSCQGGARARNVGIAEARGRWVAFLDDDDVWSPNKLRLQLEMARAVHAGFVYARAAHVQEPGIVSRLMALPAPGTVALRLLTTNVIPAGASNVIARTQLMRRLGGFDENLDHLTDWDMWIRLAHEAPAGACDEAVVGYVEHATNRYKLAGAVGNVEFDYLAAKHSHTSVAAGVRFDGARFARGTALGYLQADRRVTAAGVYLRSALAHRNAGNAVRAAGALMGEGFRDRFARDTRRRPRHELSWLEEVWDADALPVREEGVRSGAQNSTYW
jgi:glycosyltransferase involved in cell wall biosynthesis